MANSDWSSIRSPAAPPIYSDSSFYLNGGAGDNNETRLPTMNGYVDDDGDAKLSLPVVGSSSFYSEDDISTIPDNVNNVHSAITPIDPINTISDDADRSRGDFHTTDRYGFITQQPEVTPSNYIPLPLNVLRNREKKWLEMLDNWPAFMNKNFEKVKERCRKGIPPSIRPRAWKYLCGAQYYMSNSQTKDTFKQLDRNSFYSKCREDIQKDIFRQFPNHEMFARDGTYGKHGQEDLLRLLLAWTVMQPDEGYCQGQAPVAATLLTQMPLEDAFYCFVQICQKYLPGYYSPGLEAIQLDGDIVFALLRKHSYSSYKHLKKQGIDPSLYMIEWFMCAFCRTLPWSSVLRVWDMFFCEGVKILFKVAVVLFKYCLSTPEQLKMCPGMYETLQRLRNLPPQVMHEEFLTRKIIELNISDSDLERIHYKQTKLRSSKKKADDKLSLK